MSNILKNIASRTMKSSPEELAMLQAKSNKPTTIQEFVKKNIENSGAGMNIKKNLAAGGVAATAFGRDLSKRASDAWGSTKATMGEGFGKAKSSFTEAFPNASEKINKSADHISNANAYAGSVWGMANEASKGFMNPTLAGMGIGAGVGGAIGGFSENGSFWGGMAGGASLGALGGAGYKAGMNKYKTGTYTNPEAYA